ncbi:hypothetical protein AB9E25_34985, partial [Rhizobium leguminosarum]
FPKPFLITNRGGPGGGTETLGMLLYRQGFTSLNFGYASAIDYTMAALAVSISLINLWVGRDPKLNPNPNRFCCARSRCT